MWGQVYAFSPELSGGSEAGALKHMVRETHLVGCSLGLILNPNSFDFTYFIQCLSTKTRVNSKEKVEYKNSTMSLALLYL